MVKPTVAFAERVTAFPPSPVMSTVSAPSASKTSALNGMLIALISIVFGLGIMYLLSRVMQTSRKLVVLERQVKQQQLKGEDVDMQLSYLHLKASAPAPSPPPTAPPAAAADTPTASSPPIPGFPGNMTVLEMSPDMLMPPSLMNLFCEFMETGPTQAPCKEARVEEIVEEPKQPVEKLSEDAFIAVVEEKEEKKEAGGSSSESEEEKVDEKAEEKPKRGRGAPRGRRKAST